MYFCVIGLKYSSMNDNNHVNDIPEDGDDTVERARVALNLDFELKLLQIKARNSRKMMEDVMHEKAAMC